MLKNNFLFVLFLSSNIYAQVLPPASLPLPPLPSVSNKVVSNNFSVPAQSLDVQQFNLSTLLNLIFLEYKVNYVLDPFVNEDVRQVSMRWNSKKQKIDDFLPSFLDMLGYELNVKQSVYYVSKRTTFSIGLIKKVYKPDHRTTDYLLSQLSPLFPNNFLNKRSISVLSNQPKPENSPPNSASSLLDQYSDVLIFNGTENEWKQVFSLIKLIDTPESNVKITAKLYEVSVGKTDGSSFGILAKIGNSVNVNFGLSNSSTNYIKFGNDQLSLIYSAIDSDNRFKLTSSPFLVAKDGKQAEFSSGSDVPTLSAVITDNSGKSTQSIEYKNVGTIFKVLPKIRKKSIDLTVEQTLSDVVNTTTGLNNTPTIPRRSIKTELVMNDSETIVIGGLKSDKQVKNKSGFFIFNNDSSEQINTEILLFITINRDLGIDNLE